MKIYHYKKVEGLFEQIRKAPPINQEEVDKFWEKLKEGVGKLLKNAEERL